MTHSLAINSNMQIKESQTQIDSRDPNRTFLCIFFVAVSSLVVTLCPFCEIRDPKETNKWTNKENKNKMKHKSIKRVKFHLPQEL